MEGVLDEPHECNRTRKREHKGEAVLNHRRHVAASRRRLFARDPGGRSSFGLSVVRWRLGATEARPVRTVNKGVDGHEVLGRQPELLIPRPGNLRDDDMGAPADFDIGPAAWRRCALDQQAFGGDVADADVEPAGILLQARGDQHLSASVSPLVRLC